METQKKDTVFLFIYIALIFFSLGLTASPTIVSGYHILIFIPMFFCFKRVPGIQLKKSSLSLLILAVWGLLTTAIQYSTIVKPFKSFQEVKYYLFGVLLIWPLVYFFKRASQKQIRILLNILLFTIVTGFFVGIARSKFGFDPVKWQSVPGKYHIRLGGFTNYMRYGYSSALMLILGIGAFFNFSKVSKYVSKKWLITFCAFNLLAVIFSETRGAALALLSGSSFMLLRYRPKIGKVLVGGGILAVLSIGVISAFKLVDHRYLNINDGSNKVRMSQFYTATKAILDNPILGLGADQFSYNVIRIKKEYGIWADDYSGHAHNILLEHGANYGVPGLFIFISFLIFWFLELIKDKKQLSWVIASYLVAFVIGGQVELLFDVINSHLIFFLYAVSQGSMQTEDLI